MMPFLAFGMYVTDLNLICKALQAFWHSHCNLRSFIFSNISDSLSNRYRIEPLYTLVEILFGYCTGSEKKADQVATFKEYYADIYKRIKPDVEAR
jgi:hypothetical protein